MLQRRSAQREMVETVISIARVAYAQFPPILNGYGGTVIQKNEKTDCVSRERRLKKRRTKEENIVVVLSVFCSYFRVCTVQTTFCSVQRNFPHPPLPSFFLY